MLTRIHAKQLSNNGTPDTVVASIKGELQFTTLTSRCLSITNAVYSPETSVLTLTFSNGQTWEAKGFIKPTDVPIGPKGDPGRKGFNGFDGLNGRDGEPGVEGSVGERGYLGLPGRQGEKGYSGRKGVKGYKGERGDRGDAGGSGASGLSGIEGKQGPEGASDRFSIIVSESDPGALGPGAIWVKPSGFVYGQDRVSFTLVATENKQHLYQIQELWTLDQQGVQLPGEWFARDLHIATNEYSFTNSELLASFFEKTVFCVYRNISSFGRVVYVVKANGGIVEIGQYEGPCVVSNVDKSIAAIVCGQVCCLYNTDYEYVQETIQLPAEPNALALIDNMLIMACADGVFAYDLKGDLITLSEEPAHSIQVDDFLYVFGQNVRKYDKLQLLETLAKADYVSKGVLYSLEKKNLIFNGRVASNVDKVVVSDRVYVEKGGSVYALTDDGQQFITAVFMNWYVAKNVLVEYDKNTFFIEELEGSSE